MVEQRRELACLNIGGLHLNRISLSRIKLKREMYSSGLTSSRTHLRRLEQLNYVLLLLFLVQTVHYTSSDMSIPPHPKNKQHRWGMLGKQPRALNFGSAPASTPNTTWESFDHTNTLSLGYAKSTFIAYKTTTFEPVVLRSCRKIDYSPNRELLVEISKAPGGSGFVEIICIFAHNENVFIGSQLGAMALADLIDCTIPLQEMHLATTIKQVGSLPRL